LIIEIGFVISSLSTRSAYARVLRW